MRKIEKTSHQEGKKENAIHALMLSEARWLSSKRIVCDNAVITFSPRKRTAAKHSVQTFYGSSASLQYCQRTSGDGYAKILEQQVLCISRTCRCSWTRETLDLALLAKLRGVQGLKVLEIAAAMNVSRTTVKRGLRTLRANRGNGRVQSDPSDNERKGIPWESRN